MDAKANSILFLNSAVIHGGAEEVMFQIILTSRELGYNPVLILPTTGWLTEQCERYRVSYEVVPTLLNVFAESGQHQRIDTWLLTALKIRKLARKWNAVLVYSNTLRISYQGGLGALLARTAKLTHCYDMSDEVPYSSPLKAKILMFLADLTLVPSHAVEQKLVGYAPKLQKKIQVLYNGWPANTYEGVVAQNLHELYGIPQDAVIIGTASAIEPYKGQAVLVEAFKLLQEQNPNIYLIIAGSPRGTKESFEYEAKVRKMVEDYDLKDKVIFTGWREDIWTFIKSFDIVAHAPVWPDPLPTLVVHSCGLGRAIVGSRIGGIPEIVLDGYNGILVPPSNPAELAKALKKLADDPELREKYGQNARQRFLARFSKEEMKRGLAQAYERCLKRKKPRNN